MRDKAVLKTTSGTRKCNCKTKVMTRQLGPGMFQQYQTQECGTCPAVKLEREQESITVHVEPGMTDGQVGVVGPCLRGMGVQFSSRALDQEMGFLVGSGPGSCRLMRALSGL